MSNCVQNRNGDDSLYKTKTFKKDTWSCQSTFLLLSFLGLALAYSMRGNLSVTIVAIVKQPEIIASSMHKQNSELECPYEKINITTSTHTTRKFDMSRTEKGFALGSSVLGLFISNLFGGIAAGRFGGKLVMGLGIFFSSVLTIVTPLVITYSVSLFIFVRLLMGISEGVVIPAAYNLASAWATPEERSHVVGTIQSGTYLGMIATFISSGVLSESSFLGGWPSVFYLCGGLGIIWTLFWFKLIHDSPEVHPRISQWEHHKMCLHSKNKMEGNRCIPFKSILTSRPFWGLVLMHCAVNYCFYLLLSEVPSYFAEIHHMGHTKNGTLSCVPYAATWIVATIYSKLITKLTIDDKITILNVRRLSMILSGYVPAVCFIALCFVGCDQKLAVAILIFAEGITGCQYSGFASTPVDLSPRYAGEVMGFSSGLGNLAGFSSTLIMEHLLDNYPSQLGWQYGFILAAAIYGVTTTIYLATVETEIQPWNYHSTDQGTEEEEEECVQFVAHLLRCRRSNVFPMIGGREQRHQEFDESLREKRLNACIATNGRQIEHIL